MSAWVFCGSPVAKVKRSSGRVVMPKSGRPLTRSWWTSSSATRPVSSEVAESASASAISAGIAKRDPKMRWRRARTREVYLLIVALEDVPAEGAQHHLGDRVGQGGLGALPGLFDQRLGLLGARLDRARDLELLDHRGDHLQILRLGRERLPQPA